MVAVQRWIDMITTTTTTTILMMITSAWTMMIATTNAVVRLPVRTVPFVVRRPLCGCAASSSSSLPLELLLDGTTTDNHLTTTTSTTTAKTTFPPVQILDQNDDYMVIAKPPSVVCHYSPYSGKSPEVPILQRVREQMGRRVNLVHRLDRGSSGCLLIAFADQSDDDDTDDNTDTDEIDDENSDSDTTSNIASEKDHDLLSSHNEIIISAPRGNNKVPRYSSRATSVLSDALADKMTCTKTYIALVRGEGILHGEDLKQKGWFLIDRAISDENGVTKEATTWFRFIAGQDNGSGTIDRPRASLVLARPQTGRWHQIRKHLNGLSHPILGDATHGNSRTNREWKERYHLPAERTCLHLSQLILGPTEVCPEGIHVSCPLASDMMTLLRDHLPTVLAQAIPILEQEGIIL